MIRLADNSKGESMGRKKAAPVVDKPHTREQQHARRRLIADMVKGGAELEEAAEKFGVSVMTVRLACRQFKVKVPHRRKVVQRGRPKERQMEILAELIAGSGSLAEIAERFGVSKQYVHQVQQQAQEAGVFANVKQSGRDELVALREKEAIERRIDATQEARSQRRRETEQRYQRIIDLINAGKSVEETASAVGMNTFYVYRVLERFNVEAYAAHRINDETRFKIVRELMRSRTRDDLNMTDIAKRHGVSLNAVIRIRDTAEAVGLFKEAKRYEG